MGQRVEGLDRGRQTGEDDPAVTKVVLVGRGQRRVLEGECHQLFLYGVGGILLGGAGPRVLTRPN